MVNAKLAVNREKFEAHGTRARILALSRHKRRSSPVPQSVILYRMVLPDHTCPYGLRARQRLESSGVEFQEQILSSREEVDAFQDEHGVDTTPQLFVDGERIGGSEELERWLQSRTAVSPARSVSR